MTARELIEVAEAPDIRLTATVSGSLRIDAPTGSMTPHLLDEFKVHREELISWYRGVGERRNPLPDVSPTDADALSAYFVNLNTHLELAREGKVSYPPPLPPFREPPNRAPAWSAWWDAVVVLRQIKGGQN